MRIIDERGHPTRAAGVQVVGGGPSKAEYVASTLKDHGVIIVTQNFGLSDSLEYDMVQAITSTPTSVYALGAAGNSVRPHFVLQIWMTTYLSTKRTLRADLPVGLIRLRSPSFWAPSRP